MAQDETQHTEKNSHYTRITAAARDKPKTDDNSDYRAHLNPVSDGTVTHHIIMTEIATYIRRNLITFLLKNL